jgi:hypothetical protein
VVHHDELVGHEQDQVALVVGARDPQLDRLELEGQVVPEGAEQPVVRVPRGAEEVDDRSKRREDRRLAAALLLREAAGRRRDASRQSGSAGLHVRDAAGGAERALQGGQEHAPALVERAHLHVAAAARDHQRGIGEPDVPARVAARILVARREQHPEVGVEPVDDRLDGVLDAHPLRAPDDADAAVRAVALLRDCAHAASVGVSWAAS